MKKKRMTFDPGGLFNIGILCLCPLLLSLLPIRIETKRLAYAYGKDQVDAF
jgi:hypothetical protein